VTDEFGISHNYSIQYWYSNTKLHHDGDKPAVVNGELHSDGDMPAIVCPVYGLSLYVDGLLHHDGDKPAIVTNIGIWIW
jgi:hypothetical protein